MSSQISTYERQEDRINYETGEMVSSHTVNARKIKTEKEPDYIKVYKYTNTVFAYKGIPLSYVPAVIEIGRYMSYAEEGQIIAFNKFIRTKICETLGIKMGRLDQIVKDLKTFDILRPVGYKGVYAVNPFIIGCGDASKIAELRASFDYDANKMAVQTKRKDLITGNVISKIVSESTPRQLSLLSDLPDDDSSAEQ